MIHHAPADVRIGWEIAPQDMSTGANAIMTETCRLSWFRASNTTPGSVTLSVTDGEGIYVIPTITLPVGGWVSFHSPDNGDLCPSGVTINVSGTGVHVYAKGIKL